MNDILKAIRKFLADRFDLQKDIADETAIIASISENVEFRGANLFALVFAIIIASVGLNVNATAVVIGAMLISPIMGPIMGVGLGIGINDFQLVKKGFKNLLVATVIGAVTSTVYFLATPLHEAQSELLARTSPNIWDVFIAFFGGLAGMVAASRKEKSNVIPGVAIATALMPPLCTAGFGIATGNWLYFVGAIYLYFINSVFIAIATFLMVRYLKLRAKHFESAAIEKRVTRYMIVTVVITLIPCIFMAYRIVDRSIFETNAAKFVTEQFRFRSTQVVSRSYKYGRKRKSIDLLLVGKNLDSGRMDSLKRNLALYNLAGVTLNMKQGLDARNQVDLSQIKASILEDVFNNISKPDTVGTRDSLRQVRDKQIFNEIKVLYPNLKSYGLNQMIIHKVDTAGTDTIKLAYVSFKEPPAKTDIDKLQAWLSIRYKYPALKLIVK